MKSTLHIVRPAVARLVCTRCGRVAQAGTAGWRELTAVSHAGATRAAERVGHEVALDLCRGCLRAVLKAALGVRPTALAATESADSAGDVGDVGAGGADVRAIRSMADAETFIRASMARLEAWRRDEADREDPPATTPVQRP